MPPSSRSFTAAALLLCTAAACVAPADCQLNGECLPSGVCACAPPWAGPACSVLDVLPAAAPDGAFFRRANISSWCASALANGNSSWDAVVSVFAGGCGLDSWTVNSELVHATAATAAGPFTAAAVIRLPFSHNPKLLRAADGTLLVFHIGCGDNATRRYGPCQGGVTPLPPPPPASHFVNGGGCLAPAGGAFPAWTSPGNVSLSPLALARGAVCANASSAGWLVDRVDNRWYSAAWPQAQAFVDCASCAAGAVVALVQNGGRGGARATGFVYNETLGVIQVAGCAGMCLSNGGAGARAPCGGGAEPWSAQQIHLVPCASAAAAGWAESREGAGSEAPTRAASSADALFGNDAGSAAPTCGGSFTEILSAPSFAGPWAFETAFGPAANGTAWPFSVDNPAPLLLADGSIAVMFRSYAAYNSTIGIARAPSWRGPWTLPTAPIFYGHAEDPTWWFQSATSSFHALFHGLGACGVGAAGVGCHAFSADGVSWTLSSTPAYSLNVAFDDGTNTTFSRRERPQVLLDARGAPTHLVTAVQLPAAEQPRGGRGDASYTLVVPLRT